MSVLMEFSIFPIDQGESLSVPVSEVVRMVRDSGVEASLTAMGTIIETDDVAEALELVHRAVRILEARNCRRIYSTIKLDIRVGKERRLKQKIGSVQERIGSLPTAGSQSRGADP